MCQERPRPEVARSDGCACVGMSAGWIPRSPRFFCATRDTRSPAHHERSTPPPGRGTCRGFLLRSGGPKDIEEAARCVPGGIPTRWSIFSTNTLHVIDMRARISRRPHTEPLRPVQPAHQFGNAAEQAHLVFPASASIFLPPGITAGWSHFRKTGAMPSRKSRAHGKRTSPISLQLT